MKELKKKDYVNQAEKVVLNLSKSKSGVIFLTTNKIRNMLTIMNELYNAVKNQKEDKISEEIQSRVQYAKMKLVYEAGRDKTVRELLDKSSLLEYINGIGENKKNLILVCHYMEALVAYHKYHTKEK